MYTTINFRTKKALTEAFKNGDKLTTFQAGGLFPPIKNGPIALEGPHYPAPHAWYAQATVRDGVITSVK